ncbi:hypothetical protein N825_10790 [Skermanella stibiiresistens SB22]|uniref:Uncharacterized protein n=1 Tax=Skermanella stibiiresistens SB22 TaxID=1385369 RepID=W9GY13_9PROT|nr:hypothetical protein [Skermanella stibiiresistens]EWY38679.1 hypothetical protein N825_10790 [Skermanella stibiiresistens SB22]
MTEGPIELDSHRGMAALKATEDRRHTAAVEADQAQVSQHLEEMTDALSASPAATWDEAAKKMLHLLTLFAGTVEARDHRHQKLIASAREDIERLSSQDSAPLPG